jgi:hypothetical protein
VKISRGSETRYLRKLDFQDVDENQIFQFQKRTGSTRIAESPMGATLFAVKNASLYCEHSLSRTKYTLIILAFPHWTVSLTGASESSSAHWIAKGDEAMESVVVNWGGFCVGRISCPSKRRKHTVCKPRCCWWPTLKIC